MFFPEVAFLPSSITDRPLISGDLADEPLSESVDLDTRDSSAKNHNLIIDF